MRRALGSLLIVVGAGLLLLTGLDYLNGAILRDRARAAWDAFEAHQAVLAIQAHLADTRTVYGEGAVVGRLLIPKIGLDEVVTEGVSDEELAAGPGHLPGSASPGELGNSVISAHRDRHFHSLDGVAVGDTVITETASRRTTWVVISRRIVERGQPALFQTTDATLTLTTCWPVRYIGPAPERLLITAKPVGHLSGA